MTSHEPRRAAGDDRQPRSEAADRVHAMLVVSDFRRETPTTEE